MLDREILYIFPTERFIPSVNITNLNRSNFSCTGTYGSKKTPLFIINNSD